MIDRYSLPEMSALWSDAQKLELWTEVEALALEAWAGLEQVPSEAAEAVRRAAVVTPEEVAEREKSTNHDLAAFVDLLSERSTEWVHYGLTSSDILDTAMGARLAAAVDLLLYRVELLFDSVKRRAFEHRDTVMVGRTHGIWAEPTSFGLKLATWAFELARDHRRLFAARSTVAVGKISGAVGSYAHVPPQVEAFVCEELGLAVEPASSQVVMRDRHAELLAAYAVVGASIDRFATEIRHLQRSEVNEARERFGSTQKGSSAMPHKRNPVTAERMSGLARLLRGYAQVGFENVALWHERDISHSSAERVALPDACLVLDYMLATFRDLIENLEVDEARMEANVQRTRGLIFSQAVLLALVGEGLDRDAAYRIVQRNAIEAWEGDSTLQELLAADPNATLAPDRLEKCFDPSAALANAGVVFERLDDLALQES